MVAPEPPPLPTVESSSNANKSLTKTQSAQLDQTVPGMVEFLQSLGGSRELSVYGLRTGPTRGRGRGGVTAKHPARAKGLTLNVQAAMQGFLDLPPAQQAQIQSLLYRAGFYTSQFVPLFGHLKEEDIAAWVSVVNLAVAQNMDIGHYLRASAGAADRSGIRNPAAAHAVTDVITLSDPKALSASLNDAFQAALGHNATADEKARFVATFRAKEAAYQEQMNAVNAANTAAGEQSALGNTPESQGLRYVPGKGYIPDPMFQPPVPGAPGQRSSVTLTQPTLDNLAGQVAEEHPVEASVNQLGQHGQEFLDVLTRSLPGGMQG